MYRLLLSFALMLGAVASAMADGEQSSLVLPASDEGLPGKGPLRRYEWFQRLWKARRGTWAASRQHDQRSVVFLGDSITQGWGPRLAQAFPGVKVANRGISGDTTRGMLLRLEKDVITLQPRVVVMLMGTNDLEEGATPETIASNVKSIIDQLRRYRADLPIVLCDVFPSSASKKRPSSAIREINARYAELTKGDRWIWPLDTWTLFANEQGDARPEEFPDLLHPNQLGYDKWAAALRPVFATLDLLERDAEPFRLEPGYTSLFSGYDLNGWQFRPSTEEDKRAATNWRQRDPQAPPWPILTEDELCDGLSVSSDGRFAAKNGRLVVMMPPERRKIQQFWTQQEFSHDFVLKLEFRATPNADSGVFIRGRQLQCRDYALAGPYRNLQRYRPQEWNELVIIVRGETAYCTCNGEVLEEAFAVPATGPIGLEGDRGQVEYRRIRIKQITSDLPRSTPEQQGVSSVELAKFVQALDNMDSIHSIMLLRHGSVIAEGWWAPFQPEDPHWLYSLSKSFASTAVGLAIAEGKLSLDDRVTSYFPDQVPEKPSYKLQAMRVRDLLSMSTGHEGKVLQPFVLRKQELSTASFLALPVEHQPGTHFQYNTSATYMCSAIVQAVTGEKLVDYLQSRLFDPLGIVAPKWRESSQGISFGGYGLSLRTEDIARFGQMLLQHGEWQGRQLVPREWVEQATSRQTSTGSAPDNDWSQGYGFQFWQCRHGFYRGDGLFGQFCIVMPPLDAVLVVTSGTNDMGRIMNLAWDHLIPAMHNRPLGRQKEAQQTLRQLLSRLQLEHPEGHASSEEARKLANKTFAFPTNDMDVRRMRFECGSRTSTLHLQDGNGEQSIQIGFQEWRRNRVASFGQLLSRSSAVDRPAIAASGAWDDHDTFKVRLWFYETPYRLDLAFRFSSGRVEVTGRQHIGATSDQNLTLTGQVER